MSSKNSSEINQSSGDNSKNVVNVIAGKGNKVTNGDHSEAPTVEKKGLSKEVRAAIIGGIFVVIAAVISVVFSD